MKVKIGNNYSETVYSVLGPFFILIFINDLPSNTKSEMELFPDDIKLFVWPISKDIVPMDLGKLSYWEDI